MEAAVEDITLHLRQAGRTKNTRENVAAEVASSACSRLGALWAASVDSGRLTAAATHVSRRLLKHKRDMGQLFKLAAVPSLPTPLKLDVFSAAASSPLLALWTPCRMKRCAATAHLHEEVFRIPSN